MLPRILELIPVLQIGGAERQLLLKCRLLSGLGYEVIVAPLRPGGALETSFLDCVEVLPPPTSNLRATSWRTTLMHVRKSLQATRPDIVVGHLTAGAIAARMASATLPKGSGPRAVDVWHGYPTHHFARQLVLGATKGLPAATVAVSKVLADGLVGQGLVDCSKTTTIRNAVPTPQVEGRSTNRKSDLEFRLLAVGRLVRSKNFDVLVRAMSDIGAGVTLTIVGDGPEREALVKLTSDLGIAERVRFLGNRRDVEGLYAEADVLVHPSTKEGFGLAPVEAHLSGLDLILADLGIYRELFHEGVYRVADPRNPDSWTREIRRAQQASSGGIRPSGHQLRFDPDPDRMASEWDVLLGSKLWE